MYESITRAGPLVGPAVHWLTVSVMAFSSFYGNAYAQVTAPPVIELAIDAHVIQAEVAADPRTRSYGLMNRTSLPADTGMLFVFESEGRPCFWMKNTPLPLSIAFIDRAGFIVNMADMQPHSTASHCPQAPVVYALEMEQGWFKSKGIKPGARVKDLPRRPGDARHLSD